MVVFTKFLTVRCCFQFIFYLLQCILYMKRVIPLFQIFKFLTPAPAAAAMTNMDLDENLASTRHYSKYDDVWSRSPSDFPEISMVPLETTKHHVLLYKEHKGKPTDMWAKGYVKMPFSDRNVYDNRKIFDPSSKVPRWEVIEKALQKKPFTNSQELHKAILKYNKKFERDWKFYGLHRFLSQYLDEDQKAHFFKVLLPFMIKLALRLPELVQVPIPLLQKNTNMSISMSKMQIASLLANAFFCTYPRRNDQGPKSEFGTYPKINFNSLFETPADDAMEKLRCILNYFERIRRASPEGIVTFSRRFVHHRNCPQWENSTVEINTIPINVDDRRKIEEMDGYIQVDFANKFLGGGVLGSGCVQEEIRFVISPELMVAMLFTEQLDDGDAVLIIGSEKFSSYNGYGRQGFKFAGDYHDMLPKDGSGRLRSIVLAIDAIEFHSEKDQYARKNLLRELNKAWIGFSFHTDPNSHEINLPPVATGNWGCGAFGGTPQLKSLLQLCAAAHARRPLKYLTFGDSQFKQELEQAVDFVRQHNVTVGKLYNLLMKYYHEIYKDRDLLTFLRDELTGKSGPTNMDDGNDCSDDMNSYEDASNEPASELPKDSVMSKFRNSYLDWFEKRLMESKPRNDHSAAFNHENTDTRNYNRAESSYSSAGLSHDRANSTSMDTGAGPSRIMQNPKRHEEEITRDIHMRSQATTQSQGGSSKTDYGSSSKTRTERIDSSHISGQKIPNSFDTKHSTSTSFSSRESSCPRPPSHHYRPSDNDGLYKDFGHPHTSNSASFNNRGAQLKPNCNKNGNDSHGYASKPTVQSSYVAMTVQKFEETTLQKEWQTCEELEKVHGRSTKQPKIPPNCDKVVETSQIVPAHRRKSNEGSNEGSSEEEKVPQSSWEAQVDTMETEYQILEPVDLICSDDPQQTQPCTVDSENGPSSCRLSTQTEDTQTEEFKLTTSSQKLLDAIEAKQSIPEQHDLICLDGSPQRHFEPKNGPTSVRITTEDMTTSSQEYKADTMEAKQQIPEPHDLMDEPQDTQQRRLDLDNGPYTQQLIAKIEDFLRVSSEHLGSTNIWYRRDY